MMNVIYASPLVMPNVTNWNISFLHTTDFGIHSFFYNINNTLHFSSVKRHILFLSIGLLQGNSSSIKLLKNTYNVAIFCSSMFICLSFPSYWRYWAYFLMWTDFTALISMTFHKPPLHAPNTHLNTSVCPISRFILTSSINSKILIKKKTSL